jgi:polyisoprenoid-binding protein YceI
MITSIAWDVNVLKMHYINSKEDKRLCLSAKFTKDGRVKVKSHGNLHLSVETLEVFLQKLKEGKD